MTYNVFSGTLNPTHSLTHAVMAVIQHVYFVCTVVVRDLVVEIIKVCRVCGLFVKFVQFII